jgi:hypothetical protein
MNAGRELHRLQHEQHRWDLWEGQAMKCSQKRCRERALYWYRWPGCENPLFACADHAATAKGLAAYLEFRLELRPISTWSLVGSTPPVALPESRSRGPVIEAEAPNPAAPPRTFFCAECVEDCYACPYELRETEEL